jgi:8-oxo-dGTP diphosphatase
MAVVHVAVGVIVDRACNVLITRRARDSHQGGLWEFPGGKVEHGESLQGALARELSEELGIAIEATRPLLEVRHDYGDKTVLLDVHLVQEFTGTPRGLEQQPLKWVPAASLHQFSFPAANVPIVEAVQNLLGPPQIV